MSDAYSIQEVGGTELARHYPDRGILFDSDYHQAVLTAGQQAVGWRKLFARRERFLAVLSANREGLRVFVAFDRFAVFIPWSEIAVSAERSSPGTNVHVRTAALPSLAVDFHLDDFAADTLFKDVMPPLPQREPPGRLYWPKSWAVGVLLGLMFVTAGGLAWLQLSWDVQIAAAAVLSFAIAIFWYTCRPIFEENRPERFHRDDEPRLK
jgi:hypothetical protein